MARESSMPDRGSGAIGFIVDDRFPLAIEMATIQGQPARDRDPLATNAIVELGDVVDNRLGDITNSHSERSAAAIPRGLPQYELVRVLTHISTRGCTMTR